MRVLRRNVALNRLSDRVEVVEAVVSEDGRDTREIWPGRAGTSSEWTLSREFAAREDEQPIARSPLVVPATTLDAAFSDRSLDLLKVDVEGAEGLVLAGARRLLAEQRPIVVLEFHREAGWPAIEILQEGRLRLRAAGRLAATGVAEPRQTCRTTSSPAPPRLTSSTRPRRSGYPGGRSSSPGRTQCSL